MRLLIVTQAVDTEDSALGFFHRWIQEFATHCESVHVICLKEGAHDLPSNVFIHSLGKERGRSRVKYVSRFYRYAFDFRREYDAVFVHMNPEYVILGGAYWRLAGKKIALWYVHRAKTWWLLAASRLANVLITSVPESLRISNEKLLVVGHAIDVASFPVTVDRPIDSAHVRMVALGRITRIKNIDTVLQAMAELRKRGIHVSLDLVGAPIMPPDFPYVEELKMLAQRLELSDHVQFLGAVPHREIPKLLSTYDVSVNASPTGGIDKTVLESVMSGSAVVMSNKAFTSFFGDDSPALLFAEGSAAELADRIEGLVTRRDLAGLKARLRAKVVDSSDIQKLVPRILDALS